MNNGNRQNGSSAKDLPGRSVQKPTEKQKCYKAPKMMHCAVTMQHGNHKNTPERKRIGVYMSFVSQQR